jgi:hypothetical protein
VAEARRRSRHAIQPVTSSAASPPASASGLGPRGGGGSLMSRSVADEGSAISGTISTDALSLGRVPRDSPFTERMNGSSNTGTAWRPVR